MEATTTNHVTLFPAPHTPSSAPVLTLYEMHEEDNSSGHAPFGLEVGGVVSQNSSDLAPVLGKAPLAHLPLPLLVAIFFLQLAVVMSALLGNAVVLAAIARCRHVRGNHARYIASLAVADFGVAATAMPFALYRTWNRDVWGLGMVWCRLYASLDLFFSAASLLMLTVMTLDRYLAICHPMAHQTMRWQVVAGMITCCWLVPILVSFVPIMSGWHQRGGRFTSQRVPSCNPLTSEAFTASSMTLTVIFPAAIIFALNARMYMVARRQSSVVLSVGGGTRHWGKMDKKKLKTSNSCPNLTTEALEFAPKVVKYDSSDEECKKDPIAAVKSEEVRRPLSDCTVLDHDSIEREALLADNSNSGGTVFESNSCSTEKPQKVFEIATMVPRDIVDRRRHVCRDREKISASRFAWRTRRASSQKLLDWESHGRGYGPGSKQPSPAQKPLKNHSSPKLRKNTSDSNLVGKPGRHGRRVLTKKGSDSILCRKGSSRLAGMGNGVKGGHSSPPIRKKESNSSLSGKTRAARTVGLLTGVFLMCWLPCWVLEIVTVARGTRVPPAAYQVTLWLAYLNSSLNPLLYCITSKSLTAAVRALLRRKAPVPVVLYDTVFKDSLMMHGSHV